MFVSRRIDTDIFYPQGTLCLKVHRNGEMALTENTVYPVRIPGYEKLQKMRSLSKEIPEQELMCNSVDTFLRNRYKSFAFVVNDLDRIAVKVSRETMERFESRMAGYRFMVMSEREEMKKWSLEKNRDKNLHDSMQRSKKSLIDYAFNNQWTHFATFTVDSEKCDRTSLAACNKKIGTMLNQFRRYYCEGFRYLLVPEQHKDGAFHYHGLVYFPEMPGFTNVYVKRKILYTIDYFTQCLGYNSFSLIKDQIRAAKYITKYVDKQMKQGHIRNIREQIADAKLLLHSRGLRRPVKFYFRQDAIPDAIHAPTADPDTGEVCFTKQIWGACRSIKDIAKLCSNVVSEYAFDAFVIIGSVFGFLSKLRKNEYFDIKI